MGEEKAFPNEGKDWTIGELALCYLVAKSRESQKILSDLLGRSEGAINFAWRWCDGANFPAIAGNRIEDHIVMAKRVFGEGARGWISHLPAPAPTP